MNCRHCQKTLEHVFADLGVAPPSNAYLEASSLATKETKYPLRVLVCDNCWLVQTEDFASAESLFSENYAYFSSFSTTWLEHSKTYVEQVVSQYGLDNKSMVAELAANDGYLLQYVVGLGIPCYGVEPTASTASVAKSKGIPIYEDFFGLSLAKDLNAKGKRADLVIANNVLAHVPDINDFVSGVTELLSADGVATFEFPHLCELVKLNQFDTIYHEHFSYLSLTSVDAVFRTNGLQVIDVELLDTHGGSLRVHAQRADAGKREVSACVYGLLKEEAGLSVHRLSYYQDFNTRMHSVKKEFIGFLEQAIQSGKSICAYGAAAKGNTLLNFANVDNSKILYVVDRNPSKQDMYLPGSHIPIVDEEKLKHDKPDYIVIFPWNLAEEIIEQLEYVKQWGAKCVIAIPELTVFD